MSTLTDRALEIAVSQIGIRELGHNRGPAVEQYQRAVHIEPGDPWCAAFVSWCIQRAASELGELLPMPITGSVHLLWGRAPEWAQVQRPVPGAVFCHDSGQGRGHCGFVMSVTGTHLVTIEGNTDDAGSREGDGVYRKSRRPDYVNLGYLLFDLDAANATRLVG